MRFKIYGETNDILKKPLLITEESFNLVPSTNSVIARAIRSINNYDFFIDIDDKMYNLNDYFTVEIAIKSVFKLYFVFENNEKETDIQNAVVALKDMPTKTPQEKEEKVKSLLSIMKEFKPFMVLSNQYLSYLDKDFFDESTMVFMKANPEEKEEKKVAEKNNIIIDTLFLVFMPALMLVFLYITMDFFNKGNGGLGILLTFITVLEIGIFGYSLILINKEEKNKELFSKYHVILYLINVGGILLGLGLAIIIGNFLLKTGEIGFVLSLAFISFGATTAISIALNIGMYYLNRWLIKRKNSDKKAKVKI